MDLLVSEEDDNPECDSVNLSERKSKSTNVGMGADVMSNQSLELKSEPVAQDCWPGCDQEISVKEELLHEELDIKSEDEAVQETPIDDKHLLGNKLCEHRKHPSGLKPFKCHICDYICGHKGHLHRHLATHTGVKPFNCNICDYSCIETSNLKRHIRTHTREKPFKCHICDYSTGQNNNLKNHLRTHTREKPFKCNICDYCCALKSTLKIHLRSHTGEKPFKCNICHYRSAQRPNLILHLRRCHMSSNP